MCLVHDLAESIVGDITPSDGISKDKKFQLEKVRSVYVHITVEYNSDATSVTGPHAS